MLQVIHFGPISLAIVLVVGLLLVVLKFAWNVFCGWVAIEVDKYREENSDG